MATQTEIESIRKMARALFLNACATNQEGELFMCLIEGGSATIDAVTGEIVMVTAEQLDQLHVHSFEEIAGD